MKGELNIPQGTVLKAAQQCGCGEVYKELPSPAITTDLGLWFDCPKCGSCNLVPNKTL